MITSKIIYLCVGCPDTKAIDMRPPLKAKLTLITLFSICICSLTVNLPASAEVKDVLDPHQFFGQAKAGYVAAQKVPEICDKLFCYCGCDLTDCHGSLLECFTSDHGVDCHICQEEALIALKMHRKNKSLAEIQKYIDKRYEHEYPFQVESEVLKKYKAERLWKDSTDKDKNKEKASSQKKESTEKKKSASSPSCCSGKKSKSP